MVEVAIGEYEVKPEGESPRKTHHVTVYNLDPNKKYFFRVKNGRAISDSETIESFTTAQTINETVSPEPVYGKILDESSNYPEDTLVLLELADKYKPEMDKERSTKISSFLNNGSYSLDIMNVYKADLSERFNIDNPQDYYIRLEVIAPGYKYAYHSIIDSQYQPVDDIILKTGDLKASYKKFWHEPIAYATPDKKTGLSTLVQKAYASCNSHCVGDCQGCNDDTPGNPACATYGCGYMEYCCGYGDPCQGHCGNSVQDCGETGVDCGGGGCRTCAGGSNEASGSSCVKYGTNTQVEPGIAGCNCAIDGVKNNGENGIDCGGDFCPSCTENAGSHCFNGQKDADELGTDCGGSCAVNCPTEEPTSTPDGSSCSNPGDVFTCSSRPDWYCWCDPSDNKVKPHHRKDPTDNYSVESSNVVNEGSGGYGNGGNACTELGSNYACVADEGCPDNAINATGMEGCTNGGVCCDLNATETPEEFNCSSRGYSCSDGCDSGGLIPGGTCGESNKVCCLPGKAYNIQSSGQSGHIATIGDCVMHNGREIRLSQGDTPAHLTAGSNRAIDVPENCGTPVDPAITSDFTTCKAECRPGYGCLMLGNEGRSDEERVAHLDTGTGGTCNPSSCTTANVCEGNGAKIGTTGNSTGCHIHYETKGNPCDNYPGGCFPCGSAGRVPVPPGIHGKSNSKHLATLVTTISAQDINQSIDGTSYTEDTSAESDVLGEEVLAEEDERDPDAVEFIQRQQKYNSGIYVISGNNDQYREITVAEDESVLVYFVDSNNNGTWDEGEEFIPPNEAKDLVFEVEKVFDMTQFNIEKGWNAISIPMVMDKKGSSEIETAADLMQSMNNQNAQVTHIVVYRGGKFYTYSERINNNGEIKKYGDDFKILPGEGYFVKAYNEARVELIGNKVKGQLETILSPGWNLVGIYNSEKNSYKAFSLLESMQNSDIEADILGKWENGRYVTIILEDDEKYGFDFRVYPEVGYWIRLQGKETKRFKPD
jgi:hypothetical protein